MGSGDENDRGQRRHRREGDYNTREPDDRRGRYRATDSDCRKARSDGQRDRRRSRTPESTSRRPRSRERHRGDEGRRRRSREETGSYRRRADRDTGSDEERERRHRSRRSPVKQGGPLPSQEASFAITKGEEPEKPKEKANYGNTGLLAAASNSVAQADGSSITLKYHEPAEARKPSPRDQWKLFVFKDGDIVDTIDLSLRSCWLVGRELAVVDLPAEHPSISKQHAVIQFRYIEKRNEFGDKIGRVKPYLIDLESANGSILNDKKVPESRYLELRDKDMIQFGHSAREYVVMLAPKD